MFIFFFTGPVMSCDWFCDGDQLVTASWDHLALLWDAHTGTRIHSLRGRYTMGII